MISSIHALQSSTTREKLLKSVQALRPFLCESLRKIGFDPFEYTNGDDIEQTPHYGNEKDSLIRSQNSGNLGRSEVHGTHEQDGGNEGNAQCHGPHADHVDEGHDAGHTHQQYNHIGCGHNVIVLDENNGLTGYVPDDYYINDLVPDQCIGYGHEGNRPNSSANMPQSSTDMLSSLEPSMCLHGMHSLTPLGFISQDVCRFPTEDTLQPTFHPHNLYSYTHLHSQHNYQEFQHYSLFHDIIDGMAASMYNIDHNTYEARCNDDAINKLPIAITPVFSLSASTKAQVSNTTCAKAASLPQSQQRKRPRTSFDEMEDDDGDNCSNSNAAKASGFSSNLVCERRRRKKINEALYALRSVVPIVSKMDKASIMSDALTYAKQLRKRVDDLQNDILNLQVGKDDVDGTSIDEHVQKESSGSTSMEYFQSLPKHKILELSVFNIENNTYHLQICCKKGPGDLLQLARMIEALNFDILNSNVVSVGDRSTINTVVVKVDTDEVLKPEEVKEMMLEIVSKYGLLV